MTDQLELESAEVWSRMTSVDERSGKRLADDPALYILTAQLVAEFYVQRRRHFEPEIGEAWHPDDWRMRLRDRFPGLNAGLDFESGWADILVAGATLVADAGQHFGISYGKEKFGHLSLFPTAWPEGPLAYIDDVMEALSVHICEVCGAPGRNRSVKGWWRTECDSHHAIRENRR